MLELGKSKGVVSARFTCYLYCTTNGAMDVGGRTDRDASPTAARKQGLDLMAATT